MHVHEVVLDDFDFRLFQHSDFVIVETPLSATKVRLARLTASIAALQSGFQLAFDRGGMRVMGVDI